jgi:hypothetical protein
VGDDLSRRIKELLPDGVVDELLDGACSEEEIVGSGGLLSQLTKRLVERAMEVELTDHLGYEPHLESPGGVGNARNGTTPKTLVTEHGPFQIDARGIVPGVSSRRSSGSISDARMIDDNAFGCRADIGTRQPFCFDTFLGVDGCEPVVKLSGSVP